MNPYFNVNNNYIVKKIMFFNLLYSVDLVDFIAKKYHSNIMQTWLCSDENCLNFDWKIK